MHLGRTLMSLVLGFRKAAGLAGPAPSTLLDGLVSYWPLNETSGVRYDAVGSNDLTDNNTVGAKLRGPEGTVASFVNANSEYLSRAVSMAEIAGNRTVAGWFYFPDNYQRGLFHHSATPLDGGPNFLVNTDGGGNVRVYHGNLGYFGTQPHGLGWHFIEYSYDGSYGYLSVDGGTPVASALNNVDPVNTSVNLYIGCGYDAYWDGEVALVGWWSRALTSDERTSLFASGNGLRYADLPAGLTTGLVSWWELDEVSGVRYDSHGSNDLTDNNTVGSVNSGPEGTAASFVAANSEYLSGDSPFSDVTSFSLWFKTSQSADYPTVFWASPAENNPPLGVYFTSSNTLVGRCTTSDNVQNEVTIATGANNGAWHHLMGWFDPDDKKGYFSLDGATPVTTAAHSVSTLRTSGVTALSIGWFLYALFEGQVDEVAIWDRVLTADERTALFASGRGKRYADLTTDEKVGLVSYWNLDEQSGVRYDSHGSNDLTDNNTVGSVINAGGAMDGAAASFVAANSEYLSTTASLGDTTWSIAGWIRRDGLNVDTLVAKGITTIECILRGEGGAETASLFVRGANDVVQVGGFTAASWHLLIGYHDADANEIGISIDGGPYVTAATGGANLSAADDLTIGGWVAHNYHNGQLDEVAIWDRVLTTDERAELYAAGRGKYYGFS